MTPPGAAVEPHEFPPPFDERALIVEADRSRGRADRGRRRDRRRGPRRPRLRQPAARPARRRAGADGAARRGAGGGDRKGQGLRGAHAQRREHGAVGDAGAVPGSRSLRLAVRLPGGDQGRGLPADQARGATAEADAAQLPQPRQLRDLGLEAVAVPRRAGGGEGRVHAHRDGRRQAPGRRPDRPRDPLRRSRPWQGGRGARQLRARLRRRRQGDGAGRGHARAPDPGRARVLRPPGLAARALGARA